MGEIVQIKQFTSAGEVGYIVSMEKTPGLMKTLNVSAGLVLEGKMIGEVHIIDTDYGKFKVVIEKYTEGEDEEDDEST